MQLKQPLAILTASLMLSSAPYAAPSHHIVIAPSCLLSKSEINYTTLATQGNMKLIQANDKAIDQLAASRHQHTANCGGFMDVTRDWQKDSSLSSKSPSAFLARQLNADKSTSALTKPVYKIQHQDQVESLLKTVNPQNMWNNLTNLTSFDDRYSKSSNGVKAANWIKNKIESIAKETGHDDVTVYFVKTGDYYKQPSVVAKFGNSNAPGIVVGGHMDTLNSTFENKPGADDDGSGSVTVMETARTILASGMKFEKPIYFIWYSAEEMGLVGSGYVVADFQDKKIPVEAAIQLDMTGYAYQNEPTMWLMTDYVSKDLTTFLSQLISTYVKKPVDYSKCGYACSDHASWNKAGIAAGFPFESEMGNDDPYIHTGQDKMEHLSLEHMTDYVKLATSFAVELATPVK